MSNAARKARKRAGVRYTKQAKAAPREPRPYSLGFTSMAEILAGLVIRGR